MRLWIYSWRKPFASWPAADAHWLMVIQDRQADHNFSNSPINSLLILVNHQASSSSKMLFRSNCLAVFTGSTGGVLSEYLPSNNCTILVLRVSAASGTAVNFHDVLLPCNYLEAGTRMSIQFGYSLQSSIFEYTFEMLKQLAWSIVWAP